MIKFFFVNISFLFLYSLCEAVGGILVELGIKVLKINQNESIISFICTISSSVSAILLYYLVLRRLLTTERQRRVSVTQYIIYAIISAYVLINIGSILFLMQHEFGSKDYMFLLLDAVLVIFINLYLFYLLDIFGENRDLKYRLRLYESQAKSNYEYYAKQIESNRKALTVIHDIRKHIRVMEDMKQMQISRQLQGYTDSFEKMIEPLLVKQYSSSAILNIIINDKDEYCERNGIQFDIDIQPIYMEFMKPIDITTVFGNLLDNAIDACKNANEKRISLKIYPFNEIVYVQVTNTYQGKIHWGSQGRPLSTKGDQHGIGLENVEKVLLDYNGSIQYSTYENYFSVEVMISKP